MTTVVLLTLAGCEDESGEAEPAAVAQQSAPREDRDHAAPEPESRSTDDAKDGTSGGRSDGVQNEEPALAPSPTSKPCRKTQRFFSRDGSRRRIPRVVTYAYDEAGRLVQKDWGHPAESPRLAGTKPTVTRGIRVQVRKRYVYDDTGRKIRVEADRGMTGSATKVVRFRYDEKGQLIEEVRDEGHDGSAEWKRTLKRDDQGRVVVETIDEDADGSPDEVERKTYPSPQRTITKKDEDGDGKVDKTIVETRVSDTVSETRYKSDGRVTTVAREERTLDEAGRVVHKESTMRMRGHQSRSVVTFERDERGRKVAKKHDGDADGSPESIVRWDYECEWEPEG